jgi:hypothetical protein
MMIKIRYDILIGNNNHKVQRSITFTPCAGQTILQVKARRQTRQDARHMLRRLLQRHPAFPARL